MPRGYRHIVLAIGLVLYTSLAYSQDQPDATLESEPISEPRQADGAAAGEQNAQSEDRQPPDYTSAFERIESAIQGLKAEVDELERQRQEQREIGDLNAQQEMAIWAERVFWASLATIGVTLTGLFLIWRTLRHTRRAADYAGDMVEEAKLTTAAANETVSVTRVLGQKEMRAYVGVGATTVKMGDEGIVGASMRVDNTGQTPAKNMTSRVSLSVRQHPSQDPLPVPEEPPVTKSRAILHGGKSATVSKGFNFPLRLDRASQQMIADGRGAIFMHGEITYEDVFDDPHTTEFCLIHTGAWGGEHKMDVYETGNKAD